jgi:glycosyltransferase involved in cell wall biosynthesis
MTVVQQSKISIVITNFNRATMIDRAIRSCLSQLIFSVKCEVIIVDDASTDNSLEIISEFKKDISLFVNKINRGVAYSSNIGIKNSTGSYWMRVDSDDFLNQFACHIMKNILDENEEFDFVYCDHIRVNMHGIKTEKVRLDTEHKLFEHGAGVMFRKSVLLEIGGYNEMLRNAEDYDLLARILKAGYKGYYLPMPLYRYYIHGKNLTLDENRIKSVEEVRKKHGI